jgi:hypothetical protein
MRQANAATGVQKKSGRRVLKNVQLEFELRGDRARPVFEPGTPFAAEIGRYPGSIARSSRARRAAADAPSPGISRPSTPSIAEGQPHYLGGSVRPEIVINQLVTLGRIDRPTIWSTVGTVAGLALNKNPGPANVGSGKLLSTRCRKAADTARSVVLCRAEARAVPGLPMAWLRGRSSDERRRQGRLF